MEVDNFSMAIERGRQRTEEDRAAYKRQWERESARMNGMAFMNFGKPHEIPVQLTVDQRKFEKDLENAVTGAIKKVQKMLG